MRVATLIAQWIVRLGGIAQIVLGLLFWSGRALRFLPMHMSIGLLVTISVLLLSILAASTRAAPAAVIAGVLLALAMPALGMTQMGLLVGQWHWVIRVLHLAIGLGALRMGEALAMHVRRATSERPAIAVS